ncbi:MAG: hydrogenase maturation nickel metallochaperone HypA [Burkholderiaceae bacterium]|nr:hydrogenase maturation nickel metallochaperone HypA [Burkholderiaceae bacterium]
MHELSVCQGLLAEVERVAMQHRARGVERIDVRIGVLAGVEPELLASAFEIARAGTIADDAVLRLSSEPARIACRDCAHQAEVPSSRLVCPACGTWKIDLIAGDALLLERVVLIGDDDPGDAGEQPPALAQEA